MAPNRPLSAPEAANDCLVCLAAGDGNELRYGGGLVKRHACAAAQPGDPLCVKRPPPLFCWRFFLLRFVQSLS